MTEATWGRRETLVWPPHKPIYTLGALFLSFIAAGFFVYLRFHFALSPLEQFYLPTYIKTSVASIVPSRSRFQMLLVSDGKGRAWYAREEDVEAGSTPQLNAKPIPLIMSYSARHRGPLTQSSGDDSLKESFGSAARLVLRGFVYSDMEF